MGVGDHLVLPLGEVIAEGRKRSFTGTLTFSWGVSGGTVLFRCGKPVCARYGGLAGTAALGRIEAGEEVVRGEFSPCSLSDLDAVLPSNAAWQTGPLAAAREASTTARPVRVGGRTTAARVRMVRTYDAVEETARRPERGAADLSPHQRKEVLNPVAVRALRHLKDDFQNDASTLLKEMNMEHLLIGEEKKSH